MLRKIQNALVSVSEKEDLTKVLKILRKNHINIISSGGTFKKIKSLGYKCLEVSSYTGFKEMLNGRVKTLHPRIHAEILHDRSNKKHKIEMRKRKFSSIDLVVVNFYPFKNTVQKTNKMKQIIENIDIGGPTLVRAAAKNYKDVTVITDKSDYHKLVEELQKYKGKTSIKFREEMSCKAFASTAFYDATITQWFNEKLKINFPENKTFFGKKIHKLRYGENPHQKSAIYLTFIITKVFNMQNQN